MKLGTYALFLAMASAIGPAIGDDGDKASAVSFSTLITTPLSFEGLTNDNNGNLYAPGRALNAGEPCPVWRTPVDNPSLTIVGLVPAPSATTSCSPSGLAFGPDGQLYVTQTDRIYRFTPNASSPPTATLFATGVPGTNGIAFDWTGNLWTGDGTTGQGRVWRISPQGTVTEMFRVPPMANEVNLSSGTGGVGRDVRTLGPGTITVTSTSRNAANTLGSQPLVVNGVIFDGRRVMYIADTARGAIWRIFMNADGSPSLHTGCDTTFTPNTLCLDHVFVAHPILEGADGIVADAAGNLWVDTNERNAVAFVFRFGRVIEIFRSPPDPVTQLRNGGPLETPASPVLVGHKFCTSNSDGNRRDNFPSSAGEIGGTGQPRGKITCLDQTVSIPGADLPVR